MFAEGLLILCMGTLVAADLRMASQPNIDYKLRNQGTTPWKTLPWRQQMHYRYFEPSHFGYQGLKNQKRRNYDNFLRSNIDNEQDNRNFNTEDGKDHLPFRSFETMVYPNRWKPAHRRFGATQPPEPLSLTKLVYPGESILVPFRWNNPHSSEMEINIWIFQHANKHPIVIPIHKPSCSGEGHQDNVISFTVPKDFVNLGSKIPGFTGCNDWSKPLCTVQIYSHSVESRQYAIGFPIVIPGHNYSLKTEDSSRVDGWQSDPWFDLSGLRDLCLPATDPSATITTSRPRWARLVSDVYNHAYQNSDYSPYSGQQHEFISKNLQASAVNKMVTGNRGELGKSILPAGTKKRLTYLSKLEDRIYKNYETLANRVISRIGKNMKSAGAFVVTQGGQQLANCFRCAEVGSTTTARQTTNTYIPSFQLPPDLVALARTVVPARYSAMITDSGQVQIYLTALKDLLPFFYASRNMGILYQEAALKQTLSTMPHVTAHKKQNENGGTDGGIYASWMAKKDFVEGKRCPSECLFPQVKPPVGSWYCVANNKKKDAHGPYPDKTTAQGVMQTNRAKRAGFELLCKMTRTGAAYDGPRRGYWFWRLKRQMVAMCNNNIGCRSNVPPGTFQKPLVIRSMGTNTSKGPCAPCAQFFGKLVHALKRPSVTTLSKELVKQTATVGSNYLPTSIATLGSNPDDKPSLLQEIPDATVRRRRRTAFIQKSQTDQKMINKRHLKMVRQHMEWAEHRDVETIFSALDDVTPLPVDD